MSQEQQYYTDRSNLVQSILDFLKICDQDGRNPIEELSDVVYEAGDILELKIEVVER